MPDQNTINLAVLTERLQNFEENMERRLDSILEQTSKTNGRVSTLEIAFAILKGKAVILGTIAGGGMSIIVAVIISRLT